MPGVRDVGRRLSFKFYPECKRKQAETKQIIIFVSPKFFYLSCNMDRALKSWDCHKLVILPVLLPIGGSLIQMLIS
jgi:hypothetical protein